MLLDQQVASQCTNPNYKITLSIDSFYPEAWQAVALHLPLESKGDVSDPIKYNIHILYQHH